MALESERNSVSGGVAVGGISGLEWLEGLPCAWHRSMVRRAAKVLPRYPGVAAVFVTGSLASSIADRFSDLDLGCVVADDAMDWWASGWRKAVEEVAGPLVLANPIGGTAVGGFVALTPRWEHIDLVVHPASAFTQPAVSRVLYDPRGVAGPPELEADEPVRPYYPGDVVELFLYLLGVATVTLGRGEILLAHGGVLTLRDQLVTVMLAENGVRKSGGGKRLNRYLTAEQRATLLGLPVAEPEPAAILRTYHATTTDLITRARPLAAACGGQFPDPLLEATDAHLARELGAAWTDLGPLPAA